MAANQIASGAVVISTSADPLVAGLNKAKADVDAWGVKAQASMKASTSGMSAAMSAAWEKSNDTMANRMKAAWERSRAETKAQADAAKAQLERMKADADHFSNKTQRTIDTKGLDLLGGKGGGGSNIGRGLMKGMKLGEVAEMGLAGGMVALGNTIAKTFSTHYVEQFNAAMERSKEIAADLQVAIEKGNDARLKRFENAGPGVQTQADIEEQLRSAEQAKIGMQNALNGFRDQQRDMLHDKERSLKKGLFGWIGPIGQEFEVEEKKLKEDTEEADKRLRRHNEYIENLKKQSKAAMTPQGMLNPQLLTNIATTAAEASKKIAENTEATIKSLRESRIMLGMDPGNAAVFAAKQSGVTDQQKLAEIRLEAEGKARKEATLAIGEQIKAMEMEAAAYGLTAEQAKRQQFVLNGATENQLRRFDELTERAQALKQGIEDAMAPKVAGAVLAGSQEDYAIGVRMQGFDIGDGNAVQKQTNEKLDKILEANKNQAKDVADMKAAMLKLEGM